MIRRSVCRSGATWIASVEASVSRHAGCALMRSHYRQAVKHFLSQILLLFFNHWINRRRNGALKLSLMLIVNMFKPFFLIRRHKVSSIVVPPPAFMTRFIMFSSPLFPSPWCSQLLSSAPYSQQSNVHIVAQFLWPYLHIVSDDNSCDHINDEVGADGGHHEPLIAHDEEHQVMHLKPLAGPVL